MTFKAPLDLTVHAPDGMYDPANEHDACGVGMVTTLNKRPERKIVTDALRCWSTLITVVPWVPRRTQVTAPAF